MHASNSLQTSRTTPPRALSGASYGSLLSGGEKYRAAAALRAPSDVRQIGRGAAGGGAALVEAVAVESVELRTAGSPAGWPLSGSGSESDSAAPRSGMRGRGIAMIDGTSVEVRVSSYLVNVCG